MTLALRKPAGSLRINVERLLVVLSKVNCFPLENVKFSTRYWLTFHSILLRQVLGFLTFPTRLTKPSRVFLTAVRSRVVHSTPNGLPFATQTEAAASGLCPALDRLLRHSLSQQEPFLPVRDQLVKHDRQEIFSTRLCFREDYRRPTVFCLP